MILWEMEKLCMPEAIILSVSTIYPAGYMAYYFISQLVCLRMVDLATVWVTSFTCWIKQNKLFKLML